MSLPAVRAGGGVVVRERGRGPEVLMVHRPRYDDWSLPKGKAHVDEPDEAAAVREVFEETGVMCTVGPVLPVASYVDQLGRRKQVRYWLMSPAREDGFHPGTEVDEIAWVRGSEAAPRLTHERDRAVARTALELCTPLYLVRHAQAESRSEWQGEDRLRTLTGKGRRHATGLIGAMRGRPLARILSSPFERCLATVRPLSADREIDIEEVGWLAEGLAGEAVIERIVQQPGPAILCSHGDIIPEVVHSLSDADVPLDGPVGWKKGSTWVIEREAGVPSRLSYEEPPHHPVH